MPRNVTSYETVAEWLEELGFELIGLPKSQAWGWVCLVRLDDQPHEIGVRELSTGYQLCDPTLLQERHSFIPGLEGG